MKKTYSIKQLEEALKAAYGKEATIEIVESIIMLRGQCLEVSAFKNSVAIIFHKPESSGYCLMEDSIDIVKKAIKNNETVVWIPNERASFLSADGTKRSYVACMKYSGEDLMLSLPKIEVSSIYDFEITKKELFQNCQNPGMLQTCVKNIDKTK